MAKKSWWPPDAAIWRHEWWSLAPTAAAWAAWPSSGRGDFEASQGNSFGQCMYGRCKQSTRASVRKGWSQYAGCSVSLAFDTSCICWRLECGVLIVAGSSRSKSSFGGWSCNTRLCLAGWQDRHQFAVEVVSRCRSHWLQWLHTSLWSCTEGSRCCGRAPIGQWCWPIETSQCQRTWGLNTIESCTGRPFLEGCGSTERVCGFKHFSPTITPELLRTPSAIASNESFTIDCDQLRQKLAWQSRESLHSQSEKTLIRQCHRLPCQVPWCLPLLLAVQAHLRVTEFHGAETRHII